MYFAGLLLTDDTYANIDSFCILSIKGDIEISYEFDKVGDDAIETYFYAQNIPSTNVAISLNVIVDNSVSPASATYSLQVFGSAN
jgi:hypothetical protein